MASGYGGFLFETRCLQNDLPSQPFEKYYMYKTIPYTADTQHKSFFSQSSRHKSENLRPPIFIHTTGDRVPPISENPPPTHEQLAPGGRRLLLFFEIAGSESSAGGEPDRAKTRLEAFPPMNMSLPDGEGRAARESRAKTCVFEGSSAPPVSSYLLYSLPFFSTPMVARPD